MRFLFFSLSFSLFARHLRIVVWYFCSSLFVWFVFRVQEACDRISGSYQPNSSSNSRPSLVYAPLHFNSDGRYFAVWSCLHRTLLHSFCNLGKPILLHLWFPFHRLCHFNSYKCRNHDCHDIFPTLQ